MAFPIRKPGQQLGSGTPSPDFGLPQNLQMQASMNQNRPGGLSGGGVNNVDMMQKLRMIMGLRSLMARGRGM